MYYISFCLYKLRERERDSNNCPIYSLPKSSKFLLQKNKSVFVAKYSFTPFIYATTALNISFARITRYRQQRDAIKRVQDMDQGSMRRYLLAKHSNIATQRFTLSYWFFYLFRVYSHIHSICTVMYTFVYYREKVKYKSLRNSIKGPRQQIMQEDIIFAWKLSQVWLPRFWVKNWIMYRVVL